MAGLALGALLLLGCDLGETEEHDGPLLLLQASTKQPGRDEFGRLISIQTRGGACVALLTDSGTSQYAASAAPTTCFGVPSKLSISTLTVIAADGEATVRAFLLGDGEGQSSEVLGVDDCKCAEGLNVLAQGVLVVEGEAGSAAEADAGASTAPPSDESTTSSMPDSDGAGTTTSGAPEDSTSSDGGTSTSTGGGMG